VDVTGLEKVLNFLKVGGTFQQQFQTLASAELFYFSVLWDSLKRFNFADCISLVS